MAPSRDRPSNGESVRGKMGEGVKAGQMSARGQRWSGPRRLASPLGRPAAVALVVMAAMAASGARPDPRRHP